MAADSLELCHSVALGLVEKAGLKIVQAFYSSKSVTQKTGENDLVTETDHLVESLIKEGLNSEFPDHLFIGEETTQGQCQLTSRATWILDPVDGTMNFVHKWPHICISLALWLEKEPVIGIVYNPIDRQLYTARKGCGATCNGFPLSVSSQRDLSKALITTEMGTSKEERRLKAVKTNIERLLPRVHGIRMLGSAALDIVQVATGAAELYVEFGLHVWDMAAAALLVTEAGGVVVDTEGGQFDPMSRRIIAAANQDLVDQLIPLLYQSKLERD